MNTNAANEIGKRLYIMPNGDRIREWESITTNYDIDRKERNERKTFNCDGNGATT